MLLQDFRHSLRLLRRTPGFTGVAIGVLEGMKTTVIGLAIGLLLAAGVGKLVSGLLCRVSPFDPVILTAAALVLSTATLLACYLPARRATRVAPTEALRAE